MRIGTWIFGFVLLGTLGCGSGPGAIRPPNVSPGAAAAAAIEAYDTDGDSSLSEAEWSASPELSSVVPQYDTNGDRALSEDEIAEGIRVWSEGPVGARSVIFRVMLQGRPLAGATVRLIPAEFLGGAVKGASGDTNAEGAGQLSMAPEDRPPNATRLQVVQPGLYRVEITHPSINVPEKFNTKTTLGIEISGTNPGSQGIVWTLTR